MCQVFLVMTVCQCWIYDSWLSTEGSDFLIHVKPTLFKISAPLRKHYTNCSNQPPCPILSQTLQVVQLVYCGTYTKYIMQHCWDFNLNYIFKKHLEEVFSQSFMFLLSIFKWLWYPYCFHWTVYEPSTSTVKLNKLNCRTSELKKLTYFIKKRHGGKKDARAGSKMEQGKLMTGTGNSSAIRQCCQYSDTNAMYFLFNLLRINGLHWRTQGGGLGGSNPPRNSEVLKKPSQIPSSVEYNLEQPTQNTGFTQLQIEWNA
jgi:hypothetical protein